jgi:hypothetical protein
MKKGDFQVLLDLVVKYYWTGNSRLESLLDHLAWYANDQEWQIVDDTMGYLEDPEGYILEPTTSPFNAFLE